MPDKENPDPDKNPEGPEDWKRPIWDNLTLFGVTVPPWLFWTSIGIILGTIALETWEHWDLYAAEPFFKQLWLAASHDKFQTSATLAICYVPVGLGIHKIKEAIRMRFFNREATEERIRAYGRAEGRVEGRAEATAELNQKWAGWVQRRDAAMEKGLPFDEPPPSQKPD